MELFYDDEVQLIRKDIELLKNAIINFYDHSKYTMGYSNPSYRDITSFSFNYADFSPLSSKSSAFNSFNLRSPRSFLVTLIFQLLLKTLLPSPFCNPTILPLH